MLKKILLISIFSVFIIQCGKDEKEVSEVKKDPKNQEYPIKVSSKNFDFTVSYKTDPEPIPFLKFFKINFKFEPNNGQDIPEDLKIAIEADMPEHQHGMNVNPKLFKVDKNNYRVEGMKFHMLGYWEIYLTLRSSKKEDKISFSYFLE